MLIKAALYAVDTDRDVWKQLHIYRVVTVCLLPRCCEYYPNGPYPLCIVLVFMLSSDSRDLGITQNCKKKEIKTLRPN